MTFTDLNFSGKVLGGSSALTYHNYNRGSKPEYDAWAQLGNQGWDWEGNSTTLDILLFAKFRLGLWPYFLKTDDVSPGPVGFLPGNTQVPGLASIRDGAVGGPIKVDYSGNNTHITPYIAEFHQSFANVGGYMNADPEGGNSTGNTLTARPVDPATSVRSYSTNAYLEPVLYVLVFVLLNFTHWIK